MVEMGRVGRGYEKRKCRSAEGVRGSVQAKEDCCCSTICLSC